ncbi:MAG: type II toxin-antitoxin system VapB family antitoxin [Desulfomonilaceae bacterium]
MKTTIQIPDSLLEDARKLAAKEKSTLKALVEEGLRLIIAKWKRKSVFRLRRASFKGTGLQPHLSGASWEQIREKTYEGRGG